MAKEEFLLKLNLLQQEAEKTEEQINLINQQISEFETLKLSLDKIENADEILANLGRGIFLKTKPMEKELFVNIGSGVVLKKTKEETSMIIDKQIREMHELKAKCLAEMEKLNFQLQNLIGEAEKEN